MAEERKPKGETAEPEPAAAKPAGNKARMLMLAGVALVVMGASIGGTLTFLDSGETTAEEPQAADAEASVPNKHAERQVAIYHNLKPPFIVNFLAGNKPRYLQAELTVVARDQEVVDSVVTYTPVIRSEILNLFADQNYATLQTEEGKQALRELLRERVDGVLSREKQKPGVESVLLTSFVMQ